MPESPEEAITLRVDDEVLFRLHQGRTPLKYADTISRVSYATGVNVIHMGTIWALGTADGAPALELDDGTVIAIEDIDAESFVLNPTAALGGPS